MSTPAHQGAEKVEIDLTPWTSRPPRKATTWIVKPLLNLWKRLHSHSVIIILECSNHMRDRLKDLKERQHQSYSRRWECEGRSASSQSVKDLSVTAAMGSQWLWIKGVSPGCQDSLLNPLDVSWAYQRNTEEGGFPTLQPRGCHHSLDHPTESWLHASSVQLRDDNS